MLLEKAPLPATSEEALLDKDVALFWQKHFAPHPDSKEVIYVPIEWVKFLIVALLSPHKFESSNKFITSKV